MNTYTGDREEITQLFRKILSGEYPCQGEELTEEDIRRLPNVSKNCCVETIPTMDYISPWGTIRQLDLYTAVSILKQVDNKLMGKIRFDEAPPHNSYAYPPNELGQAWLKEFDILVRRKIGTKKQYIIIRDVHIDPDDCGDQYLRNHWLYSFTAKKVEFLGDMSILATC